MLIYVLVSDNIGDSRLPIPNQLSSFPPFNYGRPAKIAVIDQAMVNLQIALPPTSEQE